MSSWQTLVLLFVAATAAGFVDAVAGGGGLLTVPALLAAGLPPQLAIGTNKLQSACGTAFATWHYARAGLMRGTSWGAGAAMSMIGGFAGASAVNQLDPAILKRCIPWLLLALAIFTALRPKLGEQSRPARLSPIVFAVIFGLALGGYDGFWGPGTGSFWMMACVLVQGMELRQATGYTKAANLSSNVAALVGFVLAAKVDYSTGALMAVGNIVGARLGAGLVLKKGAALIRPMFLTVVLALSCKLMWDAFR